MTEDARREVIRKILHMAMGLFALCLRWLAPWQAALCALAALAHNLWLFPMYGMKRLERPAEKASGYSGMIGYPAVVAGLVLLAWLPHLLSSWAGTGAFNRLVLAPVAGAWALLAFGDAAATLAGIFLRGPVLPWNPRKRWTGWVAFTVVGCAAGFAIHRFVADGEGAGGSILCLAGTALAAAFLAGLVESLPGQIDDNLTVPLAAFTVFWFMDTAGWQHMRLSLVEYCPVFSPQASSHMMAGGLLLVLNLALGLAAWRLKWVNGASCALGILFGAAVIAGTGWVGYAFLLLFYVLGQFSTFIGKRTKTGRGIAEPNEGRRDVGSVFSKGLIPAFFALVSPLAFVAALAVYAADTVASEVGKASKGRAHLLFRRKAVPAGTVGAVSLAGSLAGLAAIALFVALSAVAGLWGGGGFFMADDMRVFSGAGSLASVGVLDLAVLLFSLVVGCTAAFFAESLLNEKVVARGWYSKEIGHLAIGGMAGTLALFLATFLAEMISRPGFP